MRHARMLRIDHVMGLYRLYCVPRGMAATDGVYIRYRADELYAPVSYTHLTLPTSDLV